jgi:hypothetical protein
MTPTSVLWLHNPNGWMVGHPELTPATCPSSRLARHLAAIHKSSADAMLYTDSIAISESNALDT